MFYYSCQLIYRQILKPINLLFVFCGRPKAVLLLPKGEWCKMAVSKEHSQLHSTYPHSRPGQPHIVQTLQPFSDFIAQALPYILLLGVLRTGWGWREVESCAQCSFFSVNNVLLVRGILKVTRLHKHWLARCSLRGIWAPAVQRERCLPRASPAERGSRSGRSAQRCWPLVAAPCHQPCTATASAEHPGPGSAARERAPDPHILP